MSNNLLFSPPSDTASLVKRSLASTESDLSLRLGTEHLSLEDFAVLLSPAMNDDLLKKLMAESARLTRIRFGYVLSLYIPLYYDNRCINLCDYCGFNASNKLPRRALSRHEIREEATAIRAQGFTNLLLVAGEHPESADAAFLVPIIRDLHEMGFRSVSIEIAPLSEEVYRSLVTDAHLDGLYIYQETYDPTVYAAHHCGPKANYAWRLATPERGARAGIPKIGIGFLLGLGDWRFDAIALAAHLLFLQKHYWQTEFSISFPRIRTATGVVGGPQPVSDREFIQLVCALRLLFPVTPMSLSTRESPAFRDAIIPFGFTNISAGSSTAPGGYTNKGNDLAQFEVVDNRPPSIVAGALRERGFDPVWKDWE